MLVCRYPMVCAKTCPPVSRQLRSDGLANLCQVRDCSLITTTGQHSPRPSSHRATLSCACLHRMAFLHRPVGRCAML